MAIVCVCVCVCVCVDRNYGNDRMYAYKNKDDRNDACNYDNLLVM